MNRELNEEKSKTLPQIPGRFSLTLREVGGMDGLRRVDDLKKSSYEQILQELGKELRTERRRLNVREYLQLLEWASLWVNLPLGGSWTHGIGYELDGVHYALMYSTAEAAASAGSSDYVPKRVRVREMLEHLEDGWGLIIDYGTEVEVRLSPDELTEENERIRIKRVRQEATDTWLAKTNEVLKSQGIPLVARATAAKEMWARLNGFRVLPDSRRSKRIDWHFSVVADATAGEARERCEKLWRASYSTDPYLQHLEDHDLSSRAFAIKTNLFFTDRKALPHELDEREWRELLEHVRYEHEKRGLPFSDSIPVAESLAAWPRIDIASDAFARHSGPQGQLYKFGELSHLEPMLREGRVRVFPATRYNDPSLQPSQRDNELERKLILDGARLQLTHTGKDGTSKPLKAIGKATFTARSATDFYVWCTSTTFDPRLFDEFKADACMVIHDATAFIERMHAAMEATLPDWVGCDTLIHYYDPVRPGDTFLSAHDKEFRYAYQREYRFILDPPSTAPLILGPLDHLDLCLGCLEDFATLLKL